MTDHITELTWPDGSYRGMEPQCADCIRGLGRYGRRAVRKDPGPLDRYLDEIGPVPKSALKYYYMFHGLVDLACIDALTIGAPIRNWEPMWRMMGKRPVDEPGEGSEATAIPAWRLPTVYPDDVYVRYAKRFGHRPGPRERGYAPPLDQPDAFDRALAKAIDTGHPIQDWLSLSVVRTFTPPMRCIVHGRDLAPGYAESCVPFGADPLGEDRRLAPHANTVVHEEWEFGDIALLKAPVSFCSDCRAEESRQLERRAEQCVGGAGTYSPRQDLIRDC